MPWHVEKAIVSLANQVDWVHINFGAQNTWPEHNKGVAPIPHPYEIGPLGVGATIVFVASDIVSFSQGVQAIQLGPWETG